MPEAKTKRIKGWQARRSRLRARRAAINATQGDVARDSGLTPSYVGRVESGFVHARSYDVRLKLAAGLRMTAEELTALLEPKKGIK